MDRDHLIDLFSEFGPVTLRRMFSGYGISADGVNFAMALRDALIFRVDDETVARYEAEAAKPFQYQTKSKTVVVKSYWHVPERLYDDTDELAVWARDALAAARRAAAIKRSKRTAASGAAKTKVAKTPKGRSETKPRKTTTAKKPRQRQTVRRPDR